MGPNETLPNASRNWIYFAAGAVTAALLVGVVLFAEHALIAPTPTTQTIPAIKPLPPVSAYDPTPRHRYLLRVFEGDVLSFVLLHETGHMVIRTYNLHFGSADTEEAAADSFAASVMTKTVGNGTAPQHNGLVSTVLFWDALHTLQQTSAPGQYDWADVHQPNEQRAHKLACLLYGSNPQAFSFIAPQFHLEDQRDECVADAAKNQKDWSSIISANLDPDHGQILDRWAPHVGVLYHSVPAGLPDASTGALDHDRETAQALGILESIGRDLLKFKTDPDPSVEAAQHDLETKRMQAIARGDLSDALEAGVFPHIEYPAEGASLAAYNYTVVGDSCLDSQNVPEMNAFWEAQSHSITLCYAFVGLVEDVGKRLLSVKR